MNEFSNSALTGKTSPSTALCHESEARMNAPVELRNSSHRRTNMLWHYAPWSYLPRMVESGALRPSNALAPQEVPMLWFSANQHWEPTATKGVGNTTGTTSKRTLRQQAEFLGCIRFGLVGEDPRLFSWKEACGVAGMPRESRRTLEKVGKKWGANPAHWFATPASVSLSELVFQVWVGSWEDATSPQDMVTAWEEMRKRHAANDSGTSKRRRVN